MISGPTRAAILGLAALTGGCMTGGSVAIMPDVQVTRFHLGGDPARGQIAVQPFDGAEAGSLEFSHQAAAVERELTALGWTVVRGNPRSEQVALVRLEQGARQGLRRSGFSIGLGGGSYGRGLGVGGGVNVPVGGVGTGQVVVSELSVRIQRRSDSTAIWEGRARGEARGGRPEADPAAIANRLSGALFRNFPGESGRTVRVR